VSTPSTTAATGYQDQQAEPVTSTAEERRPVGSSSGLSPRAGSPVAGVGEDLHGVGVVLAQLSDVELVAAEVPEPASTSTGSTERLTGYSKLPSTNSDCPSVASHSKKRWACGTSSAWRVTPRR
jgi:hypothetical protein